MSGEIKLMRIWEGSKGRREGTGVASQARCRARGEQPPAALHGTTWDLIAFLLGLFLLSVVLAALPSPPICPAKAAG